MRREKKKETTKTFFNRPLSFVTYIRPPVPTVIRGISFTISGLSFVTISQICSGAIEI
jgi:hypothetical protein